MNKVLPRIETPILVDRSYASSAKMRPMNRFEGEQSFVPADSYSGSDDNRESFTQQKAFQTINPSQKRR